MLKVSVVTVAMTLASFPASALEVTRSTHFEAAPAKVWSTIGEFCSIANWFPGVETCTLSERDGKPVRTLKLKGGGRFVESLVAHDDQAQTYTYAIIESPLPVSGYEGTIKIAPDGVGSKMTWSGVFDANGVSDDEASRTVGDSYDAGMKAIASKVE